MLVINSNKQDKIGTIKQDNFYFIILTHFSMLHSTLIQNYPKNNFFLRRIPQKMRFTPNITKFPKNLIFSGKNPENIPTIIFLSEKIPIKIFKSDFCSLGTISTSFATGDSKKFSNIRQSARAIHKKTCLVSVTPYPSSVQLLGWLSRHKKFSLGSH